MNPGAMRDTLAIYARRGSLNQNGFAEAEEKPLHVIRAKRAWASDREVWDAMAAQAKSVINWEARYVSGVRAGQWILWRGQWQEIIAVQEPPGVPRRIIIKTAQRTAK